MLSASIGASLSNHTILTCLEKQYRLRSRCRSSWDVFTISHEKSRCLRKILPRPPIELQKHTQSRELVQYEGPSTPHLTLFFPRNWRVRHVKDLFLEMVLKQENIFCVCVYMEEKGNKRMSGAGKGARFDANSKLMLFLKPLFFFFKIISGHFVRT